MSDGKYVLFAFGILTIVACLGHAIRWWLI